MEATNPYPDAKHVTQMPLLRASSHLKKEYWLKHLKTHNDQNFARTLSKYIIEGVPIGYKGPPISHVCPNWNSTLQFREKVIKTLATDVALGRKSGPFLSPPLEGFVGSPMGAFLKKHSNKVRVIHDLSWPPGRSVNSGITHEDSTVTYISVYDAVKQVKLRGRFAKMCKVDLRDAYKQILVHKDDWKYLGSTWLNDKGQTEYYVDHVLPFDLRSSAKLFDLFAQGLEYFILKSGVTNSQHYLDDIFSCGEAYTNECESNLTKILQTCEHSGMLVNEDKVFGPSTILEF